MNPPERLLPPLRIAVLSGGDSAERAVSLESGAAVGAALAERGHRVSAIDPAVTALPHVTWSDFDVAFLALHGRFGEDGQVQSLLDSVGIPYTGSDAGASRLAMNKSAAKERFLQGGVPTPSYVLIHAADDPKRLARQADVLGYPLVVKPNSEGSSLGVSIVRERAELPRALEHCFRFDEHGLFEEFIAGSEWTVGLLGELLLPAIRIETRHSFYDYEAKYQDDQTRYEFEGNYPPMIVRAIQNAGRRACQALGTRGIARADVRLDEEGQPWILEVNAIPGFTAHSLVPKAAARVGIGFGDLCERAVRMALDRSSGVVRKAS